MVTNRPRPRPRESVFKHNLSEVFVSYFLHCRSPQFATCASHFVNCSFDFRQADAVQVDRVRSLIVPNDDDDDDGSDEDDEDEDALHDDGFVHVID